MDQIGVRMVPAEIRQRRAIDHRALGRAKRILQNGMAIGAGDGMHGVEPHAEAGFEQRPDGVEIEQGLHQLLVVGDRIDDLDRHAFDLAHAQLVEIDVGGVGDFVARDFLGVGEDLRRSSSPGQGRHCRHCT